jgi:hypothetical protein
MRRVVSKMASTRIALFEIQMHPSFDLPAWNARSDQLPPASAMLAETHEKGDLLPVLPGY